MRLHFAVLPILLLAAGCSDDSGTAATPSAAITLEYSTKDPAAAAAQAEKQCADYSRTAKQRPDGEGAKPNVITYECD